MSRVLPILFNGDMVRAILDGRKTVTRRICKDANECTVPDMSFYDADKRTYAVHNYSKKEHTDKLSIAERTCPICPGDTLWVQETWKILDVLNELSMKFEYRADGKISEFIDFIAERMEKFRKFANKNGWQSPYFMPKEAARLFLRVKSVRVERLQECGKGWCLGIEKEGVVTPQDPILYSSDNAYHKALREEFQKLWDSTIKKSDLDLYGWDANPYVWVVEFERCERPENIIL